MNNIYNIVSDMNVPVGTTAQRPGSPAAGYFRYNTTTGGFEGYTDSWGAIAGGGGGTAPSLDTMTGDGSDTTLTLSTSPINENATFVTIDGVLQHKDTYSISGTTLTFSEAPPNGSKVESITLTATSSTTANILSDADSDTKIQVEESSDEDTIRFDTAGSERMVITSGGDVAIGGTSADPLSLSFTGTSLALNEDSGVASFQIDGGNTARIDFGQGGSRNFNIYSDASNYSEIKRTTNHPILFGTNNTERMRILSTGQIGVGTSSPTSNGGANAGLIHIHGGSADWSLLHCTTPTTGSAAANGALLGVISDDIYVWNYDSDGIIKFGTNNTTVGEFVSNGDFYTNDGTVHSLSDKRIKRNITSLSEGLDIVKKLNPVNFEYCNTYTDDFNGIGTDNGEIHKGFIADEVQEVAPSYVKEKTGIVLGEEVDDLKTLSMTAMIPMLVKAIQEQQEQIEALQSEINTLKGE